MSDLERRISELSPEKRELLRRRISTTQSKPVLQPISRNGGEESFPLSFAQQRLWFLDQLTPGNAFYNTSAHLRLAFALNASALARALNEIVRRHAALRTIFHTVNGQPAQVICPQLILPLPQIDLSALSPEGREAEALRRATAQARQSFDLARGPLLRTELLRLGEADYFFLLTMHHIVSDGWSMEVFFRELSALYPAFAAGMESPLAELPIQYVDFTLWQREWLAGAVMQKQLAYWKHQLANLPPLRLITDRPRPQTQTYRGATRSMIFPAELGPALNLLGQRNNATLFMVLLAAFQVLLHRYNGQDDLAVGVPIANRTRADIEGLIGFFVNTLILRVDLRGDPTFREALSKVREAALAAYAHQDLPFEKLVEELHPERDTSRNPLFQVMFQLQNTAPPTVSVWNQSPAVRPLKVERGTTQFDISFDMWEGIDGLSGQIEYSTDLFEHETIERMMEHFGTLLRGIADDPNRRISTLPLMREVEREQVTFGWNATGRYYPRDICMHSLFEAQAGRTPGTLAVTSSRRLLSYSELNEAANRQAQYLRAMGIGPGALVAICLPRSAELIIAMLSIWKADAIYLPLDPNHPAERLAWALQDSRADALLAPQPILNSLRAFPTTDGKSLRTLDIANIPQADPGQGDAAIVSSTNSGNTAYIIYTSGSTGRPKGVSVTHQALVNHAFAVANEFGLNPSDRVLQFASPSFDVAAEEIFPTLLSGGTVVLHEDEALLPAEFLAQLTSTGVTVVNLPATYWAEWLLAMAASGAEPPPGLRLVVIGSERVTPERVMLWQRLYGARVPLINAYGVTEATITALLYRMPLNLGSDLPAMEIPIGRPIGNMRAYVLDSHGKPCPVGIAGELCLGGDGLSQGYLNHPELTREKFIPDPFNPTPHARLYRTGDRARFRTDGNVEFLGRLDQQTKIRGYRVEPAEIEVALSGIPGVSHAAVSVHEDPGGERRLVGYVVPDRTGHESKLGNGEDGEQISSWRVLYDEIYDQSTRDSEPTFNTVGWNSTYDGLPIPLDEMREWTERTVSRIMALRPRRVLEIGCGTGLLLFRIAPHCRSYVGTDFSPVALKHVKAGLAERPCPQVRLLECNADDFRNLEGELFDTVVLNSVVQYFPSVDYLLRVLASARRVLAPGGAIFIGDVRSLPLLPAYHMSLELYRARGELSCSQLLQRALTGIAQEQELVIDPTFFHAIRGELPEIAQIAIEIKEGRGSNELLKFRYDVVLGTETTPSAENQLDDSEPAIAGRMNPAARPEIIAWDDAGMTVEHLVQMLRECTPETVWVRRVPNARLFPAATAWSWLNAPDGIASVKELQTKLDNLAPSGIEPDDLRDAVGELGYIVSISWSDSGPEGRYDLRLNRDTGRLGVSADMAEKAARQIMLFSSRRNEIQDWKNRGPASLPAIYPPAARTRLDEHEWSHYANNPIQGAYERRLVPALRSALKELLPTYMVPSVFVLLDALPLLPNGKVNRNTLPSPDARRSETSGTFILPRNPLEETLADIWAELLGLEQVGIHDNFFDLGGDSILAIQIISRANQAGLRFTPKQLFQNQTIAGLAAISGIMAQISSPTAESPAETDGTRSAFTQKEFAYVIEELTRSQRGLHEPERD